MSLQTDSVVLFRQQWASRLVDEVEVLRYSDAGETFNETSGQHEGGTPTTILSGGGSPNALIRPGSPEEETETFPQELRTYSGYDVYFAFDAPTFEVEDRIVVTTSLTEPDLDGKTLTILAILLDGYNTRRRVMAELDLGRGSGRG